jgi:hypothetical protein
VFAPIGLATIGLNRRHRLPHFVTIALHAITHSCDDHVFVQEGIAKNWRGLPATISALADVLPLTQVSTRSQPTASQVVSAPQGCVPRNNDDELISPPHLPRPEKNGEQSHAI